MGEWSETLLVKNKRPVAALAKCFETDRAGGGSTRANLKRLSHPAFRLDRRVPKRGHNLYRAQYIGGKRFARRRGCSLTQDAWSKSGLCFAIF